MKKTISLFILALVSFVLLTAPASAGVRERMKERDPVVDALRARGVVGENNQGFLEFRGPQEQADVVAAENADRAIVYEAIGQKEGVSSAVVGQHRAAQIRENAPGGTMLQAPDGSWYKK